MALAALLDRARGYPAARLLAAREPDDALEAAPEHALAVEGHLRRVHRLLELRILHHRLADAIAIFLVAIHDPTQRDHLVVLELNGLGKRRDLPRLSVVADRVGEVQSAAADMGVAPFLGHALVSFEVGTGNGDDESVEVLRHGTSVG